MDLWRLKIILLLWKPLNTNSWSRKKYEEFHVWVRITDQEAGKSAGQAAEQGAVKSEGHAAGKMERKVAGIMTGSLDGQMLELKDN